MILRLAKQAMGTRFELVLIGEDERFLRAAGEEALLEIEECERWLSLFRSDSLLSHINREANHGWVQVDAESFELLECCRELWDASGGAFDPSVGGLMRDFGFRGEAGARAESAVGFDGVELDPGRTAVRFARPGLELDLGAIAKGHGLDLAAGVLRDAGVHTALLHGGTSSAVAVGAPPGEPAWRIAIGKGPDAPVAELRDAALGVSAPTGRTVERNGMELGHVLDPRNATAVGEAECAAVIASTAREADAWSTALLVAGSALPRREAVSTLHAESRADGLRWQLCADASFHEQARFIVSSSVCRESA